jgi:hypothetical protein
MIKIPLFIALLAAMPVYPITGRWIAAGPNNTKLFIDFDKDSSFRVYTRTSTENSGSYHTSSDTIYMYDKNCGMQVPGKYLLHFYGADSVSFSLLQDSCGERAQEVNGARMKRDRR